jgi:hypothetical protein
MWSEFYLCFLDQLDLPINMRLIQMFIFFIWVLRKHELSEYYVSCIIQSKDGVNGCFINEKLRVVHAYHHYYTF